MNKHFPTLIILAIFCGLQFCSKEVAAQKSVSYTIEPGEIPVEKIPIEAQYIYDDFHGGSIYYEQNRTASGLFNYSYLYGEMMFLNVHGDTLILENNPPIDFITVQNDTFYFADKLLRHIATIGNSKIAVREFFEIINREKIGAMGQKTNSSSIDSYSQIQASQGLLNLRVREVITLRRYNILYIGDENYNFELVNNKSLSEKFPSKGKQIKDYLKGKNIKTFGPEEINELVQFLTTL